MERFVSELKRISGYECEDEVIFYGLDGIVSGLISFVILLIISAITGNTIALLCFLLIHLIGGRFTGSYHAKTRVRCQLLTVFSFIMVNIVASVISVYADSYAMFCTMALCIVGICFYAPVLNINKPMNLANKRENKKKTCMFMTVVGIAFVFVAFEGSYKYIAASILANLMDVLVFMLIGKEVYERDKKKFSEGVIKNSRDVCEKQS